jgi:hypothetical protein
MLTEVTATPSGQVVIRGSDAQTRRRANIPSRRHLNYRQSTAVQILRSTSFMSGRNLIVSRTEVPKQWGAPRGVGGPLRGGRKLLV